MSLSDLEVKPIMLGENTIAAYQEDCIKVLDALGPERIDLIVTDPPYLMSYKTNHRSTKDPVEGSREHALQGAIGNDSGDDGRIFIRRYMNYCYMALKNDSAMYCFCKMDGDNGQDLLGFFKQEAVKAGFKIANTIIWKKNNWTAGDLNGAFGFQYEPCLFLHKGRPLVRGRRHTDLWEFDRVKDSDRIHPNHKPVGFLMRAIEASSDAGDLVFDGTAGSGSLALAAYQTGRRSIICEFDPKMPSRFDNMVSYVRANAIKTLF